MKASVMRSSSSATATSRPTTESGAVESGGSAHHALEKRHDVGCPDVHPLCAAEAVALLVLGSVGRIDLHTVGRVAVFQRLTQHARRLEARVLRWLNQEDRNLDPGRSLR